MKLTMHANSIRFIYHLEIIAAVFSSLNDSGDYSMPRDQRERGEGGRRALRAIFLEERKHSNLLTASHPVSAIA